MPSSRRRAPSPRAGEARRRGARRRRRRAERERASRGRERVSRRERSAARRLENIAPRRTAGETRAGTARGLGVDGAVRRAGVWSARDAPWLPFRVARGSRARARASRGLRCARARRKSTPAPRRARASRTASPTRFGWWFPRAGVRLLRLLRPLRRLRRACVRRAPASGCSRARPARQYGRACGPADARAYCRRVQCREA